MKTYTITSVRLSDLGETVELTEEEYAETPYNVYLHSGLEGTSTTKTESNSVDEESADAELEE